MLRCPDALDGELGSGVHDVVVDDPGATLRHSTSSSSSSIVALAPASASPERDVYALGKLKASRSSDVEADVRAARRRRRRAGIVVAAGAAAGVASGHGYKKARRW
jgi:hypothetical protein